MAVGARLLFLGETLSKGLLAKLACSKEEFRCSVRGVLNHQSDARMNEDKQQYNEQQEHNTDIYTIRATS